MIRVNGEGSSTDNDYQFSPHTIPNVTNYMSIRRSLSHTESYVGFEGSYIHAEEPDGATGSMYRYPLQALTALVSSPLLYAALPTLMRQAFEQTKDATMGVLRADLLMALHEAQEDARVYHVFRFA